MLEGASRPLASVHTQSLQLQQRESDSKSGAEAPQLRSGYEGRRPAKRYCRARRYLSVQLLQGSANVKVAKLTSMRAPINLSIDVPGKTLDALALAVELPGVIVEAGCNGNYLPDAGVRPRSQGKSGAYVSAARARIMAGR